ncbi:MAG: hypothetical protein MZW92_80240 [Comamonadaceae bacterium]|nr:hypothetical protein [Comamonadaceae bacterium]
MQDAGGAVGRRTRRGCRSRQDAGGLRRNLRPRAAAGARRRPGAAAQARRPSRGLAEAKARRRAARRRGEQEPPAAERRAGPPTGATGSTLGVALARCWSCFYRRLDCDAARRSARCC